MSQSRCHSWPEAYHSLFEPLIRHYARIMLAEQQRGCGMRQVSCDTQMSSNFRRKYNTKYIFIFSILNKCIKWKFAFWIIQMPHMHAHACTCTYAHTHVRTIQHNRGKSIQIKCSKTPLLRLSAQSLLILQPSIASPFTAKTINAHIPTNTVTHTPIKKNIRPPPPSQPHTHTHISN